MASVLSDMWKVVKLLECGTNMVWIIRPRWGGFRSNHLISELPGESLVAFTPECVMLWIPSDMQPMSCQADRDGHALLKEGPALVPVIHFTSLLLSSSVHSFQTYGYASPSLMKISCYSIP